MATLLGADMRSAPSHPVHPAALLRRIEHLACGAAQVALTKPEIAVEEIDRVRAAGVRFDCALADAGYGMSAPFRQALSERGLSWAFGIPGRQKVYPADVAMVFAISGHGRPRQHHIPDSKSVAAEKLLAGQPWKRVSWRRGKGLLAARFAALRVRVADGPVAPRGGVGSGPG